MRFYRATKLRDKIAGVTSVLAMHGKGLKATLKCMQTMYQMDVQIFPCEGTILEGKEVALKERKGKVFIQRLFAPRYTQSAQAWITQFYLQTTPCLPFLRERSPDGTTTTNEAADIQLQLTTHLSPREDERLSWLSWLTCSGWFTRLSGHPSTIEHSAVSPAKTAEPINMPFGAWTLVEPWEPSGDPSIRWECTLAPHGEYD